ncbi:MAG TPA: 4'-phosphopantetheinyl transferase superfamily protein [Micromonosporaceae bacterium]|jgi:4'-phosphopantetheinyl transferase
MLALTPGQVRLWWSRPRIESSWLAQLDEAETGRYLRFHRAEDAARFVTGAAMVRSAFAADLDISPASVPLDRTCPDCQGPHGKVRLRSDPTDVLHVSVSHSADWVVLAATRTGPIGIDVERIDDRRDHVALGRFALCDGEMLALKATAEKDRPGWFTTCWVRKEAVVKATGHGLRMPLREFTVTGEPGSPTVTTLSKRLMWPSAGQVVDLAHDDDYRAALAVLVGPIEHVDFEVFDGRIR